jgi:DNA-directed RNA polymerase specialized sigma subunit
VKQLARTALFNFRNSYTLCLSDLTSAGEEALVLASRAYNPAKEIPFGAYARKAIGHAIRNEIRNLLPIDLKSAWKTDFISFSYGKALDDSVFNSDDSEYNPSALHEGRSWLCNWDEEERCLQERVTGALGRLVPDDRSLVEDYFGFNGDALTLEKLGEQRRVTLQAIGKRKKRILNQMHSELDNDYPYNRCA